MKIRTALVASALLAGAAGAAPVKLFQAGSASAWLAGTLESVAVDDHGGLALAAATERLAATDAIGEPFVFALARHPQGWVLGTGNAGKVLFVGRDGRVETLFAAPEPEVFALWVDADGTVFAGTSPHGKVYRLRRGEKASVWFDPQATYVWAIARAGRGELYVATGTEGKLFAVDAAGKGKVALDLDDAHVRALLPLPSGELLLGTGELGLVQKLDPATGRATTLYDSALPEIVALAAAPDGTAWAAALASEASWMDLAPPPAPALATGSATGDAGGDAKPSVTVETPAEAAPGRAPRAAGSPRSEIVRFAVGGAAEPVAQLADDSVFALAWSRGRLWIGTGLAGKLYSLAENGTPALERDFEEKQLVGVIADSAPAAAEAGPTVATTNAASLWRFLARPAERGTYTSAVLDAGAVARFGVLRWSSGPPGGGEVRFRFRAGWSAEPDSTWTAWSEPRSGAEIALADLPRARYVQWRAELDRGPGAGSGSPEIAAVELSYRQENLRPRIERFAAMDPGQILVPAGFNPGEQVFEPAHPTKDGIFTTLEPAAGKDDSRSKTLWKRGYLTLRWRASDPNQDDLRYALAFRREGDADWLPMVDELDDDHFSFDATALPDGRYRFRLTASDRKSNDPAAALAASDESDAVVVDDSPPARGALTRDGERRWLAVADALSPLRAAEISFDAKSWRDVATRDGLLDGLAEVLAIGPPPAGARLVLVRVTDAAFNSATFDLTEELGR
ncbi:MAG: hypothetical protein U0X73_00900 [Thermoanaerobaculia bacterium]